MLTKEKEKRKNMIHFQKLNKTNKENKKQETKQNKSLCQKLAVNWHVMKRCRAW